MAAVSAESAQDPTLSAIDRLGGKAPSGLPAGSYSHEGTDLTTGWHAHAVHQLEYALTGCVEVEDATGHYLLSAQQAAWIPAGMRHESTLHAEARTISVYFDPALVDVPTDRVRIVAVSPLLREMVTHAARWTTDRPEPDERSTAIFVALGHVVADALEHEGPLGLPTSTDPVVAAAMDHTRTHLRAVTVEEVANVVGVSARTLRRRFVTEIGMPWRTYLQRARILRAMTLLAAPGATILPVALAVGFDSQTSFARAFAGHCGETPSAYRKRIKPLPAAEGVATVSDG